MRATRRTVLATLAGLYAFGTAMAGGLYITEFGTPSEGAASAGANAVADDASVGFQNPAGIVFLENEGSHWLASDRTPDMPIDRQIRLGFGGQYQRPSGRKIGAVFEYMDLGDGRIENDLLVGEYESNYLLTLSVNLTW